MNRSDSMFNLRRSFSRITLIISVVGILSLNIVHQSPKSSIPDHPLLSAAAHFAKQGLYELAQPLLIEAKFQFLETPNKQFQHFADSLWRVCQKQASKLDQTVPFHTIDSLAKQIDDFSLVGFEGNLDQIENRIQLLKSWTRICERYESRFYTPTCSQGIAECGGIIKPVLENKQDTIFPILRKQFEKQLSKEHYDVRLSIFASEATQPSLLLIHKNFADSTDLVNKFFTAIRPKAKRLRFKSIIFQANASPQSQVVIKPLLICEDQQACMECFDTSEQVDFVASTY